MSDSNVVNEISHKNFDSLSRFHENVNVMFTDIVGWTKMCTEMVCAQEKVFSFLNHLYSIYDNIAASYDIYKLETIGDCYVAVSGLTNIDDDGFTVLKNEESSQINRNLCTDNMIQFAIEVLQKTKSLTLPNDQPLMIRIGIHSGPVCSGVLSYKMPRFVLTGDTMNYASRMESTCPLNTIQVSETTMERLQCHKKEFSKRENVYIKGKEHVTTYVWNSKDSSEVLFEQLFSKTTEQHIKYLDQAL